MVTCYIGIGSNLGDSRSNKSLESSPAFHSHELKEGTVQQIWTKQGRRGNIIKALEMMNSHPGIVVKRCSSLAETEPWGYADQPKFLNTAAEIESVLSPEALLTALKAVEKRAGRKKTFKWGPRAIDLDILLYGRRRVDTPSLKIPHPRIRQRPFVMKALRELGAEI